MPLALTDLNFFLHIYIFLKFHNFYKTFHFHFILFYYDDPPTAMIYIHVASFVFSSKQLLDDLTKKKHFEADRKMHQYNDIYQCFYIRILFTYVYLNCLRF